MKIFTTEQIRECDQFTIKKEPVSSIQLMERASSACANWISGNCKNHHKAVLFCGNGNNGGDGFAIARLLFMKGFDVDVFMNLSDLHLSQEAAVNYKKLKENSGISIKDFKEVERYNFEPKTMIIDALFGTGLSKKLNGIHKELISFLNEKNSLKISVDTPSGLLSDEITSEDSTIFEADYTLTFQFWKKSFLHPETGKYAGKVVVLDIDLNKEYIDQTFTNDFVVDDYLIEKIFKPREDFSHKGTYGRVAIVGGSYGKIGAVVLSTKSALRTGAGLTFTIAPKCGYEILQTSCPEAMFIEGGTDFIDHFPVEEHTFYGIGPGLGTHQETEKYFLEFLKNYTKPIVIDADALNIISRHETNQKRIPRRSIITPHPKEFERLFGSTENSFKRTELAKQKAEELEIYIVLKDHHTQIITPEGKVYYNSTGNSGLAKGGSGDILTGIITSLLAQGYTEEDAAILGVWIHGKAADFAAEKLSKEAMLPTDVIDELANVFSYINKKVTRKL